MRWPPSLARAARTARAHLSGGPKPADDDAPPATDNVSYNRHFWDAYAGRWEDPAFRVARADRPEDAQTFQVLGDEWGRSADVDEVVARFILPFVDETSVAAEIGCGGGRVARRVVDRVGTLYCTDISQRMLAQSRRSVVSRRAEFVLLQDAAFPDAWTGKLDFVYAFDVFMHLDLYVQWRYVQEIHRVLKPGGRAFLHTANLTTEAGWENFTKFDHYRVETHFYVSPETVRTLLGRARLRVVQESEPDPENFYLARDYLVVVDKP